MISIPHEANTTSSICCPHAATPPPPKTFTDYIKLSSEEIADEIDAIANPTQNDVF